MKRNKWKKTRVLKVLSSRAVGEIEKKHSENEGKHIHR